MQSPIIEAAFLFIPPLMRKKISLVKKSIYFCISSINNNLRKHGKRYIYITGNLRNRNNIGRNNMF